MVSDCAKALLLLAVLAFLDLTDKSDIEKSIFAVGEFNVQGTTVSHDGFDDSGLTDQLTAVVSDFNFVV